MAKNDRKTLKNYFASGRLPSQDDFGDLIESTLNIVDDGFDKTVEEGFKVSRLGDSGMLISFFENIGDKNALWFIKVDLKNRNLIFGSEKIPHVLSLAHEETEVGEKGKIGINKEEPEWELDVGGVIRAEGRIGVITKEDKEEKVLADGEWHDITDALRGCQAFEVMAGVGGEKKKGRYALMHAFALNTYNPKGPFFNFLKLKKRIRYHQAYYRSRGDKLKLRWRKGESDEYYLQIKSRSSYEGNIQIRYYITKLWFDEDMSQSRPESSAETSGQKALYINESRSETEEE